MRPYDTMKDMIKDSPTKGIAPDTTCHLFSNGEWLRIPAPVPREMPLAIYINDQKLVNILCTPVDLTNLVVGFLYAEGIITDLNDIASLNIDEKEAVAEVRLNKEYTVPSHQTRTPTGVSFEPQVSGVDSNLVVTPEELLSLMNHMLQQQQLYQQSGGTHGSALCDRKQILVKAEDIGRHNTLDRILGECLLKGIPTKDRILITTGRVSSEMLFKAARMQTPIIASRSSPTERAVFLSRDLGISVVGYTLGNSLSVFSHEERVLSDS